MSRWAEASVSQEPLKGMIPQDPSLQGIWQQEQLFNEDSAEVKTPPYNQAKGQTTPSFHVGLLGLATLQRLQKHLSSNPG